ncbi:MAG TPA: Uma2 family endonuclease [Candidatus Obscuribacterales bacterium]
MATPVRRYSDDQAPKLRNGDCMTREEFHRAYCAMPESYRAELIGGIVFEPSPVSYPHGESDFFIATLLGEYRAATPHVGGAQNATVMLSDEDEVQPDLFLRIERESLAHSHKTDDLYISGAPELVLEIAYSSRAIDLHFKKDRYARAGVIEYIVVCLSPKTFYWFDLRAGKLLEADENGVYRSAVFPGLWIHGTGLIDLDYELTKKVLKQGLKSPEHRKFIQELKRR